MAGKTPGAKMANAEQQQPHPLAMRQVQWQDDDESPKPPGPTGFEAVTPGIHPRTYIEVEADDDRDEPGHFDSAPHEKQDEDAQARAQNESSSYFPTARDRSSSSRRRGSRRRDQMELSNTVSADAEANGLRINAMRRRESLSEIRAANPDLALSGNIISATFNTPHAFKYRKGGDWVRASCALSCALSSVPPHVDMAIVPSLRFVAHV